MRNWLICVLTFLVYLNIQTNVCLAAISGCRYSSSAYYVDDYHYDNYYSVELICNDNTNCYWDHYSSLCNCYHKFFSSGYNSRVKQLKACPGNRLDATISDHFKNVQIYDISSTGLEVLTSDDLNFESLEELDAHDNQMMNISGSIFVYTTKLEKIDFSNNKINGLYQDDLKGASKLSTINLSHNNISTLDEESFLHTPELTTLDLSHNDIK